MAQSVSRLEPGLCHYCLHPGAECESTCPTLMKELAVPAVIAEIYPEIIMPEASDQDFLLWFPAVVAQQPQVSFSILSAITSRVVHERMKTEQRKQVLFMATEACLGQVY